MTPQEKGKAHREFFGYHEGQVYSGGEKIYCLAEGKPDANFFAEELIDPIHVIEYSAYAEMEMQHSNGLAFLNESQEALAEANKKIEALNIDFQASRAIASSWWSELVHKKTCVEALITKLEIAKSALKTIYDTLSMVTCDKLDAKIKSIAYTNLAKINSISVINEEKQ